MVTRTAASLVAQPRATSRTDAPSTAIARTILRWLTGKTARCRSTSAVGRFTSSAGVSTMSSQSASGRPHAASLGRVGLGQPADWPHVPPRSKATPTATRLFCGRTDKFAEGRTSFPHQRDECSGFGQRVSAVYCPLLCQPSSSTKGNRHAHTRPPDAPACRLCRWRGRRTCRDHRSPCPRPCTPGGREGAAQLLPLRYSPQLRRTKVSDRYRHFHA
jgi:hypothetical protein